MRKVTVFVTLKQGVLDPQGKQIQASLNSLGFQEVEEVRVGKYMELTVEDGPNLAVRVHEMCEKLLANPVIEDYRVELEEAEVL
ncbi:phosphoribosylformylglycinamidine synthase subunit PurS [Ornithinibacillus scapharcae]|uniref:phosphoribosylformylglycinamidine synthase subunit PurS n=1 Tax=Ornithinibacillus scapharcae TaxID=1147159 RepID=UPI000225BEFF|nr:phosphoribosylformylglycinamidine synthase subunit PurS [Ornithinibacillus scapharcae]